MMPRRSATLTTTYMRSRYQVHTRLWRVPGKKGNHVMKQQHYILCLGDLVTY